MRRNVILGEHSRPSDSPVGRVTLDDLFRRAAELRPDAIALADAPDRARFTDGEPRRLTFREADGVVSAIAARLRELGLSTDAIVALHLPNTVESVLTLLGVLRAGMIAAPLPLLWRQADAAAALQRIGARALVSCRRIGEVHFGELAMHIAAETFAIRFVGAYGTDLPDGIVPMDDVFGATVSNAPARERGDGAADHVAVVTFDVSPDGITPVARSHAELLTAGLAIELEARVGSEVGILGALTLGSFAGLAATLVPWLLAGGTLSLHHPFDPESFAAQRLRDRCTVAVVPGPLAIRLLDAGLVGGPDGLDSVIAVWRAPERLAASAMWPGGSTALVDVAAFGEIGLVASRRGAGGRPAAVPLGRVVAPQGSPEGVHVLSVSRTATGTIALAGPMVPRHPFPPGSERGDGPRVKVADDGTVDTGYACRIDRDTKMLVVDGPPAGVVSVGGYRFVLRELQDLIGRIEDGSTLAALPDVLAGHRLAGGGVDRDAIRQALIDQGASPLLVAAFGKRRAGQKSAVA
jgi:hypothetical protein